MAVNEWQPIETAPDTRGGLIQLYCPGPGGEGVTCGYRGVESGYWFGWHDDVLQPQPTMWAPLMEPPK